jgi:DnaD/phage-associated family protein
MRFRRRLSIATATAVGHLCMWWLWTIDNAPNGDLSKIGDWEIAEAAGYGGDPTDFVAALIECGFLDTDRHIHSWDDYAGRLLDKRAANAQRMREKRARATNVQRTCNERVLDVQGLPYHDGYGSGSSPINPVSPSPFQATDSDKATVSDTTPREEFNPFGSSPPPPPTVESYIANNLPPMTPGNIDELRGFQDAGMQDDAIQFAVDQAAAQGKRSWAYVKGILRRWEAANIFTAGAARAAEDKHQTQTARGAPQPALSKAEQFLELARRYEEAGE